MSGLLSQAAKQPSSAWRIVAPGGSFKRNQFRDGRSRRVGGGVQTESWPDAQTGLARWETVLASPGAEPDMLVCHMVFWVEK